MNLLKENAKLFSAGVLSSQNANTVTTSNDGYMRISTTACRTTGTYANRTYYTISAYAEWLKEPFWKLQDILAISTTGLYDNSYNNYGWFNELCSEYGADHSLLQLHTVSNSVSKDGGASNPGAIGLEYSAGVGGIALRFNMSNFTHSGSQQYYFEYSMSAYVKFQCSFNTDGGIQAGYAHQQVSLSGISVNLLSGSVSFSIIGSMQEYYGEPLSLYN